MGWSTRYIISTACFRLQDFRESRSRKLDAKTALVGERWKSEACKHCFQYLISVYQLLVHPVVDQVSFCSLRQHFCHSLGFAHAESNKSEKCVKLSQPYTFVHLTFWYEKWFSGSGQGSRWSEVFIFMLAGSFLVCYTAVLCVVTQWHTEPMWNRLACAQTKLNSG